MKRVRIVFCIGLLCLFLLSQTEELGQNVYYNEKGTINLAVDATIAVYDLEKDYIPFVLFMGTDARSKAVVHRNAVTLIHKDREYNMPDIQEFRRKYRGENRDLKIYSQFGKKNLVTPKMHHLRFQSAYDFFPQRAETTRLIDEIEITGLIGFATWAYFVNPGFEAGDTVVIKVVDKTNPDVWGSVTFKLGRAQ
ncbi:MAG: hypothetical protein PVH84_04425 [Candidatus Aminicenantes bacterium]|jgi:hypothetical protein